MAERITFFTIAALGAAIALAGCQRSVVGPDGSRVDSNGNQTTIETPEGKATFNNDSGSMHIQTKEGAMDITSKNGTTVAKDSKGNTTEINASVSELDLGVPFYPGSAEAQGGMKVKQEGKTLSHSIRETADAPQKVIDFYTAKLGKPDSTFATGPMSMAVWEKDKKRKVSVTATQDEKKDKTTVMVSVEQS
ncbi:MAG: hypothetical protein HYR64_04195 [Fimbriimonas ginsengisoli]|uniref:Lipoprotein n=1 Tax=Fimbriimonas ginsengisoli TaxID=1005039 RepID=A0A931LUV9_FIMGI|nr:hypothetical protein [Fimbriimonas ginsengisoli]